MIILDTNVISELLKETADPAVSAWADSLPLAELWITSITIFEIRYGLNIMAPGKRRTRLVHAFNETLATDFENRVLDFDSDAASEAAGIAARLHTIGRKTDACDLQIAGVVERFSGTLATRNARHFVDTGIGIVNPWDYTP